MNNSVLVKCLASIFTLIVLFTGCSKEYSIETGASLAATGTLYGTNGICMNDSTVGTFYDGVIPNGTLTAANDTAYVLVKVNVSTVGSYNITSDTQNGLYFSDSGYFTSTGIDTIKLKPVGTAILPISSSYTISFDSSTCYFMVAAQDSTGTGRGGNTGGGGTGGGGGTITAGQWQFTTPTGTISGTGYAQGLTSLGYNGLGLFGTTVTNDTSFAIDIALPSSTIPSSGTYTTTGTNDFSIQPNGATSGSPYLEADITPAGGGKVVTIIITSYNSSTQEIIGTFSGTARSSTGASVAITNGAFDLILQ